MRRPLIKRSDTTFVAHENASHVNVDTVRVEFHSCASGCCQYSSPVGISACNRRFHQRGVRDRARDLLCRMSRRCSSHQNFDYPLSAFAVSYNLERQRATHEFQRGDKFPIIAAALDDFYRSRSSVRQKCKCVVGGSISIYADCIERLSHSFTKGAAKHFGRSCRISHHKGQHRGHIRVNHSRAFCAAQQANAFSINQAIRSGPFRPFVRRHNGPRELPKCCYVRVPRVDQARNCTGYLPPGKRHTYHSSGAHKNL